MESKYTSRELLALRPGARLRVKLSSGREFEGELAGNPWVATSGAPGLGRVRMDVVDTESLKRIEAHLGRGRNAESGGPFSPTRKAHHEVTGAMVIAIIH